MQNLSDLIWKPEVGKKADDNFPGIATVSNYMDEKPMKNICMVCFCEVRGGSGSGSPWDTAMIACTKYDRGNGTLACI